MGKPRVEETSWWEVLENRERAMSEKRGLLFAWFTNLMLGRYGLEAGKETR